MEQPDEHIEHDNSPINNDEAPDLAHHDAIIQRRDDEIFMAEMERVVREAEEFRLHYMKSYRNRGFLITIVTILSVLAGTAGFAFFFLVMFHPPLALASIVGAVVIPALFSLLKRGPINAYKKHHKTQFMPQMAQAMGGFRYFSKRGISPKVIQKSGVIHTPYAIYEAEDCFMGQYKTVKVIMSEARIYHDKKKKRPIFDGIFILIELPDDHFKGHTIVTSDPRLIRDNAHTRWKSLQPTKPESDIGGFQIFTNRPDHAGQQATPELLKELSEASDIFDNAHISAVLFAKKFLFITIPHKEDMFEACNIFVPVTLRSYMQNCKKELEQMMEIIDIYELYNQE